MIIVDKNKCDFCGTCVAVCEADAIDLFYQDIRINQEKCAECCKCVWVCPIGAARQTKKDKVEG